MQTACPIAGDGVRGPLRNMLELLDVVGLLKVRAAAAWLRRLVGDSGALSRALAGDPRKCSRLLARLCRRGLRPGLGTFKTGGEWELEQLAQMSPARRWRKFGAACALGCVRLAAWVWEGHPHPRHLAAQQVADELSAAATRGHLELARWLWATAAQFATLTLVPNVEDYIFRPASAAGQLLVVEWAWSDPSVRHNLALRENGPFQVLVDACVKGQLEVARWISANWTQAFTINARVEAFHAACAEARVGTARWLWEGFDEARPPELTSLVIGFKPEIEPRHLELLELCVWLRAAGATLKIGGPALGRALRAATKGAPELIGWILARARLPRFRITEALATACARGHLAAAECIWASGALTLETLRNELVRGETNEFANACGRGDLPLARWLWSLGLDLSDARRPSRVPHGTALYLACRFANAATVAWLGELGLTADDARDALGSPAAPLMAACMRRSPSFVRALWAFPQGDEHRLNAADVFDIGPPSVFVITCAMNRRRVARWLWGLASPEWRGRALPGALLAAYRSGNFRSMAWLGRLGAHCEQMRVAHICAEIPPDSGRIYRRDVRALRRLFPVDDTYLEGLSEFVRNRLGNIAQRLDELAADATRDGSGEDSDGANDGVSDGSDATGSEAGEETSEDGVSDGSDATGSEAGEETSEDGDKAGEDIDEASGDGEEASEDGEENSESAGSGVDDADGHCVTSEAGDSGDDSPR